MNKKRFYAVPTVEIIDIETQHVLAGSKFEIGVYNTTTNADASMTNKKEEPWHHTWE